MLVVVLGLAALLAGRPVATAENEAGDLYSAASNYACDQGLFFEGFKREHSTGAIQKFLEQVSKKIEETVTKKLKSVDTKTAVEHDFSLHTSHRDQILELKKGVLIGFPHPVEDLSDSWIDGWTNRLTVVATNPETGESISIEVFTRGLFLFNGKDELTEVYVMDGRKLGNFPAQVTKWQRLDLLTVKNVYDRSQGREQTGSSKELRGNGTGFFITTDGYLLTNKHVVHHAKTVVLRLGEKTFPATVVDVDTQSDVALLKAEGVFPALPVGSADAVKLATAVCVVGFPVVPKQGERAKFTKGEISSLAGMRDDPEFFQISVPIQPGNSGSALLDDRGCVVGIATAELVSFGMTPVRPQNVNYALKISAARRLLDRVPEASRKLMPAETATADWPTVAQRAEAASAIIITEWGK